MKVHSADPLLRLKDLLNRLEEADRSSPTRDVQSGRAAPDAPVSSQDEVQLSSRAQELQRVRDEIAASPETRQSIVAGLKEEIATGRYRIDGTKIADELANEQLP